MYYHETALLTAVRNRLRSQLSSAAEDHLIQIEPDEQIPAYAGNFFIAVIPGGVTPGRYHTTSGTVFDHLVAVNVFVAIRSRKAPRDRQRDLFIKNTASLNAWFAEINDALDFNYDTLTSANTLINTEESSTEGFIEPLRLVGADSQPRIIGAQSFGGQSDTRSGIGRTLRYGGARRLKSR